MNLKEKMDLLVAVTKQTKDDWVATEPSDTDLEIYLHFYRGDELIATLQCVSDRDKACAAGMVAAAGFNADTMAVTFESYHSSLAESPLTGKPWRHHEMQFVSETRPEAAAQGWVTPCLSISMHERGGDYACAVLGYQIHGSTVEWSECESYTASNRDENDYSATGAMFAYLQEAMAQNKLDDRLANDSDPFVSVVQQLFPVGTEARYYHTDLATVSALQSQGLVHDAVLGAKPGSDRAKWLAERPEVDIKVT